MRLIHVLLAVAASAPVVTPSTADAHPGACAANATAVTTTAVFYPSFGPSAWGAVWLTFAVGGCVEHDAANITAAFRWNEVGNYCGHSTGAGTIDGHWFSWQSAGSVVVVTSHLSGEEVTTSGVLQVVPDGLFGANCVSGATRFVVTGAVVIPGL